MIIIIDLDIQAAEADYFMELISALIDIAEFGHESSYLKALPLQRLRECLAEGGDFVGGEIRCDLLRYEKDFFSCHFLQFI